MKLFEAFTQADTSTTRKFGGTGLGLSICFKLVNLMGGEIFLSSKLGEGSEFIFNIPLLEGDISDVSVETFHHKNECSPSSLSEGLSILVVEDNFVNQELAKTVFLKIGYNIKIANNGKDAVGLTQQKCFDIIFMDIQMPIMDGLEATKQITKTSVIAAPRLSPYLQMPSIKIKRTRLMPGWSASLANRSKKQIIECLENYTTNKGFVAATNSVKGMG